MKPTLEYMTVSTPHKLTVRKVSALVLGLVVMMYGLCQPSGEWHLECIGWQDVGECDDYCNCPQGLGPCCISWQIGSECKSCVYFPGPGEDRCNKDGRTWIYTAYMNWIV